MGKDAEGRPPATVASTPFKLAIDHLATSGLTIADFRKLKLEVLTAEATAELVGKAARSIKFPYYDHKGRATGFYRLRYLDDVRTFGQQKPTRYGQEKDTGVHAY